MNARASSQRRIGTPSGFPNSAVRAALATMVAVHVAG
jgi:hypothetical protein